MGSASAGVRAAKAEVVARARRIASFAWAKVAAIYVEHGAHASRPGSARARRPGPGDDRGKAIWGERGMSGDNEAVTGHATPASIHSLALYSVKGLAYGAVEICCTRCGMLALFGSAGHDDLALSDLAVWGRYHMCLASEPGAGHDVMAAQAERPCPAGTGGSRPTTSL